MSEFFNAINSWIANHQALVVAVGIPILTALTASLVSYLTSVATLEARKRDREQQVLFKIADYRNSWIGEMTKDLADFQSQFIGTLDAERNQKAFLISRRILMRLDYRFDEAKKLVDSMNRLLEANAIASELEDGENPRKSDWVKAHTDFQVAAGLLLSSEWILVKLGLLESVSLKEQRT